MALHVTLLGVVALVLFWLVLARSSQQPAPDDMTNVAFFTVALQLLVALLVVPALGAAAFAHEHERGTLDALQMTGSRPRRLVLDKLAAVMAPPLLVGVVAVPVLVAVFLYAGLGLVDLLQAEAVTLALAMTAASAGLALGARFPRSVTALATTYSFVLALYVGTGLVGVMLTHTGDGSWVHPLAFANPFYALHALAFPDVEWGMHLGRALQVLLLGRGRAAAWGPVLQPWMVSVAAQMAVAAAVLGSAALVARRRSPP